MRKSDCILALYILLSSTALAMSKKLPETPIWVEKEQVFVDLRPLLKNTSELEITRVLLCQRRGSQCFKTLWDITLPSGWQQPYLELLGHYSGSNITTQTPTGLQVGGSYNLAIFFNERGQPQQTFSSTYLEFCLEAAGNNWRLQNKNACIERRIREDQQGAQP